MKVSECYTRYKNDYTVLININGTERIFKYDKVVTPESMDDRYRVSDVVKVSDTLVIMVLEKHTPVKDAHDMFVDAYVSAYNDAFSKYCVGQSCDKCQLNTNDYGCYLELVSKCLGRAFDQCAPD